MGLKQMQSTSVHVGGKNFYIKPFAAFKAANLTGELASVLAPLFGALVPLANSGNLMDVDAGEAASAIMNCNAINGDKLEGLMKKLLIGEHIAVEIENDQGVVEGTQLSEDLANEIFCGEVQEMFILCFHVIKLNFNGFFKKFAGLSGKAGQAAGKPRKVL